MKRREFIALGLIWLGAARMPASAKSRYATAGGADSAAYILVNARFAPKCDVPIGDFPERSS